MVNKLKYPASSHCFPENRERRNARFYTAIICFMQTNIPEKNESRKHIPRFGQEIPGFLNVDKRI